MIQVPGYKIQKVLGEGGMATVYLAMQESLNRPVALKILKKFDNKEQGERFFNEGKFIASLNHHNIITIYDLGVVNDRCFLAMEYIEGGDLNQYIDKGMTTENAIKLLKLLARCLDFVHKQGILHRDIKPENILFRKDGTPVITDFGVAKQIQTDTSLTMDGMTIGSPHYISPEQAEHKALDAKTDIYSLGIIFYEMLTGQKPFQGNSPIEIIIAHLTTEAPPLPEHLAGYQNLLNFMIAKDAADRFDSAADLVDFIENPKNLSTSNSISQKLTGFISTTEHKQENAPKRFGLWLGVSTTILVLAASVFYFFQLVDHPEIPRIASFDNAVVEENPTEVKASVIEEEMPAINQVAVNALLTRAETILEVQRLSLPVLKQAYDTYNQVIEHDRKNAAALQGLDKIAGLYKEINQQIKQNLISADASIKAYKLTTPANDNAMFYYQQALLLDPDNPIANKGKYKVADVYADLVEANLNAFDYSTAKINVNKGLATYPSSPRLLALKEKTNAFKDAPGRAFKKVISIFD